ncbi:MAG: lectin like domain-containing protein [Candidatus Marinimicrobia bacterium]|nr:lectin like domain-containing protein [Candidatus Neomarinimicrobiota bacterium]
MFVAEKRDSLTAVSFYTAADSVNYAAKIYRSRKDLNEDRYVTGQSGFAAFTGFYTIDLDHPVSLMTDDSFYVRLYLDKGGHAYDRSSEVPVLLNVPSVYAFPATLTTVPSRAEKNESLYKINGQWRDLQYVDTTANFCIKALVNESKFTRPGAVPETGSLSAVYPNPSRHNIIIDYQLVGDAEISISLYDIRGRKVTTFFRGFRPEGYHWLKADLSALPSGIYICMLKTGNQLTDTRKILVMK